MQTPRRFYDIIIAAPAALPAPEPFFVYPPRAAGCDPETAQAPAYTRVAGRDTSP